MVKPKMATEAAQWLLFGRVGAAVAGAMEYTVNVFTLCRELLDGLLEVLTEVIRACSGTPPGLKRHDGSIWLGKGTNVDGASDS